ncbi:MAG: hypothetical protein HY278_03070 [candidate division NC10 bacterium]|nr:hypothetical protein [candidate division NC10 bacterium]
MMGRRKSFGALVGLALLLMVVNLAEARRAGGSSGSSADCRKKISLAATSAGAAIDSSGTAEVRAQGAKQRFKVSMDARVADGTTFAVFANGQLAGVITIELGDGELELNNNNGKTLPDGVNPVCAISTVEVTDGSNLILHGNFF